MNREDEFGETPGRGDDPINDEILGDDELEAGEQLGEDDGSDQDEGLVEDEELNGSDAELELEGDSSGVERESEGDSSGVERESEGDSSGVERESEGEDLDGEPEEDDLEELIRAEQPDHVESPTSIVSASSRPTRSGVAPGAGGDRDSLGGDRAIGAPIRWLRRHSMPIWARFLTASVLIVVSMATATTSYALLFLDEFADKIGNNPAFVDLQRKLEAVVPGEPQTILIVGSDLRPEVRKRTGAKYGLSDTTMLLRLDPDRGAIALFSLPRDLEVLIPNHGVNKLNEAYALGGPELTYETVRQLTKSPSLPDGLPINHAVNIDFEGFARAVNAIDCVYVDVDRRYLNRNLEGDGSEDYEEINLQPGYQALCGFNALDYARYRHNDNDVVRAARQQDFLREARQKVPPTRLITQRNELLDIFARHTTSDIHSAGEILNVLKLFIASRDQPVREIHFEGQLGPSYVTATDAEIDRAVNQFLGIEDTPGSRGDVASLGDKSGSEQSQNAALGQFPGTRAQAQAKAKKAKARQEKAKQAKSFGGDAELVRTDFGKRLARGIARRGVRLTNYYPTVLEEGTVFPQNPRVYKINGSGDGSPPDSRGAYKWVFSRPTVSEYYGFMATRWKDPPILNNPSEEREIDGRKYLLFYDGDRLRTVAWKTDEGAFWVSNTLTQSLSEREMIEIAKGMTELPVR